MTVLKEQLLLAEENATLAKASVADQVCLGLSIYPYFSTHA